MKSDRIVLTAAILLDLLFGAAVVAEAQGGRKLPWIGILTQGRSLTAEEEAKSPWLGALRELGWVEGKTVAMVRRHAHGQADRLASLAAELVAIPVDLIWAAGPPAAIAARNATTRIPVVFVAVAEPVALGLAQSLARPGGNLTGVTLGAGPEVTSKQLQLLKELAPSARRVAYLYNAANQASAVYLPAAETAASQLGFAFKPFAVRRPEDYDEAFAAMLAWPAEALLLMVDPLHIIHRSKIVDFTARHRLPATFSWRPFAEAGGLAAYSPNVQDSARRWATMIDRVLRGAKPGEIPIEQPTQFELVINMKTARALGLTIPPSLMLRADQVLE